MNPSTKWDQVKSDVFWGEIADCKHIVQIYENDDVLIDTLMGFLVSGINIEDCCIVIATGDHLKLLENHLEAYGLDCESLAAEGRYMPVNAEKLLSRFLVNGCPNKELYIQSAREIMAKGRETKRMIRMFGEMSSLLWSMGHKTTVLEMEHLANDFCERESVCLFCAYSKEIFQGDSGPFTANICAAHNKLISGSQMQLNEIYYHDGVA